MSTRSPSDVFQTVLAIAEASFKDKKISILFGPGGKTRFVIDESHLKKTLPSGSVDETTFQRVFHSEIVPLIDAGLQGVLEQYASQIVQYGVGVIDPKTQMTERAATIVKGRQVEEKLITPELRGRYAIKTTSKHSSLRRLNWEVLEKRFESAAQSGITQPYLTLNFETVRSEQRLEMFFSFPDIIPPDRAVFDVDEEDLNEIIESLLAAKRTLGRVRRGEKE